MDKFPIPQKNILYIAVGLVIMILGYALMTGGGAESPDVFSDEIFSARRTVFAPILILIGFGVEIFAIMHHPKNSR